MLSDICWAAFHKPEKQIWNEIHNLVNSIQTLEAQKVVAQASKIEC